MLSDKFIILPSTGSIMMEMSMVIILFLIFCLYISYIAAYNTGYKPNFVMFLNFIFDDYSGTQNFQKYISNIVADTNESFTVNKIKNGSYFQETYENLTHSFKKILMKLFVKGNKMTFFYK